VSNGLHPEETETQQRAGVPSSISGTLRSHAWCDMATLLTDALVVARQGEEMRAQANHHPTLDAVSVAALHHP
jgi:hypothetical protein